MMGPSTKQDMSSVLQLLAIEQLVHYMYLYVSICTCMYVDVTFIRVYKGA